MASSAIFDLSRSVTKHDNEELQLKAQRMNEENEPPDLQRLMKDQAHSSSTAASVRRPKEPQSNVKNLKCTHSFLNLLHPPKVIMIF
jgi:hypothetical protein